MSRSCQLFDSFESINNDKISTKNLNHPIDNQSITTIDRNNILEVETFNNLRLAPMSETQPQKPQQQQQQQQKGRGRGGRSGRGRRGRGRGSSGRGRGRGGRGRGRSAAGGGRSTNNKDNNNNSNSHNSNVNQSLKPVQQSIHSNNKLKTSQSSSSSASAPPPRPPIPPKKKKKNGEKGADAHVVSERSRIKFTKILMDLREDETRQCIEFPCDLTNTERKYIHLLASQIGLISKSTGKGDQRRITVSKRNEHIKQTGKNDDDEQQLPILKIGKGGTNALMKHIQRFPPTHTEEMESKETGASLIEAMKQQRQQQSTSTTNNNNGSNVDDDVLLTAALDELGKTGPREAPKAEVRTKTVDLNRRMERHEYYQQIKKHTDQNYQRIIQYRSKLPAYRRQEEVIQTVATNPITIIQGGMCVPTGCLFLECF